MNFDAMYGAVASQDRRFDGQFYTAVRTTGIYCRPSCPARTPKPENVTFYPTSAAAHVAGYRACKRCQPEAVPGTPAWNSGNDVASRAMRLIRDGVIDREGAAGLAAQLGYSSRQLCRLLSRELGAGPLALARAHRAQTARNLLSATEMKCADVAFAAGFSSIRQFNETIKEVFQLTPGQIRSARPRSHESPPGKISLLLPFREPFDAAGIFRFLASQAVEGVEQVHQHSYTRSLLLPHGEGTASVSLEGGKLRLTARLEHLNDLPAMLSRIRRLFDLDADPEAIDAALGQDPKLASTVHATPGVRVPGAADVYEILFRAVVGQGVAHETAQRELGRLAAAAPLLRQASPSGPNALFPTAEVITRHCQNVLGGPGLRVARVLAIAEAVDAGELVIDSGRDAEELRSQLLSYDGFGPRTADYVVMRVLGHPDILMYDDAAIAGARRLGVPDDIGPFAEQFRPWRSYLSMHLWAAAPNQLAEKTSPTGPSSGDGRFPPEYF